MDRIIKIAIYVAVLFFASIWVSSVIKSCNAPAETTEVDELDNLDEFEEDFFEDNLGDESSAYDSDMGGGAIESEGDVDFDTDYTSIDKAVEEKVEKVSSTKRNTKTYNTNNSGKYMVLAGSYLLEGNASNMVGKLDKLGYDRAEIVVFNMSQYHSVCAARLSNYNDAIKLSNELKRNGIDNYVHTKI